MDDESCFGLSNMELSGNAGYYTSDSNLASDEVKTKRNSRKNYLFVLPSPKKAFQDIT